MDKAFRRMYQHQEQHHGEAAGKPITCRGDKGADEPEDDRVALAKALHSRAVSAPWVIAVMRPKAASERPIVHSLQPNCAIAQKDQMAG